jgi:parallel beta-helix repeat protein
MTTYYISGTGNDKNNGSSESQAFRTFDQIRKVLKGGDTVLVMNGTYENLTPASNILSITGLKGTAAKPTTIKAYPGATPILQAHKNNWNAIGISGSSYLVIEGLTVRGARNEIDLNYALSQRFKLNNPATAGNGITATFLKGTKNTEADKIHSTHLTIRNNKITNFPGAGISTTEADYITIENNTVSGNSYYSPFGTEGISNLRLWNSDNNTTGYKLIMRGNISSDNIQKVPWYRLSDGKITEGHGIMVDTAYDAAGNAYRGRILVANNVAYNNGGAGISIYRSTAPIDIVNNTTYQNGSVIKNAGNIGINSAQNIRAYNNIMYARTGGNANLIIQPSSNIVFDHNLAFNGGFQASDNLNATGLNNIVGQDPQFVNAAAGNFALKPGSAAIDKGSALFNSAVSTDILGANRRDGDGINGVQPDLGAYEYTGVSQPTASNPLIAPAGGTGSIRNDAVTITVTQRSGSNRSETLVAKGVNNKIYGLGGQDQITGAKGVDQIYGGNGNDRIWGRQGNDTLSGEAGNDQIWGDGSDDILYGGAGDDKLYGGAGSDWLYGGAGNDILVGNGGADVFVFDSEKGTKTIRDFKLGTDKIALDGGLALSDLSIRQRGNQSWIVGNSDNQVLAKLDGVKAAALTTQSPTAFFQI